MKNIVGVKGEIVAANYLKQKNYKILQMNYVCNVGEIDIVAQTQDTIVFVEVKTRNSTKFGLPREAVTGYKQNKIRLVASVYLQKFKQVQVPIRFDVIEILNDKINHIENAF